MEKVFYCSIELHRSMEGHFDRDSLSLAAKDFRCLLLLWNIQGMANVDNTDQTHLA